MRIILHSSDSVMVGECAARSSPFPGLLRGAMRSSHLAMDVIATGVPPPRDSCWAVRGSAFACGESEPFVRLGVEPSMGEKGLQTRVRCDEERQCPPPRIPMAVEDADLGQTGQARSNRADRVKPVRPSQTGQSRLRQPRRDDRVRQVISKISQHLRASCTKRGPYLTPIPV
jgi:hypothetical protein